MLSPLTHSVFYLFTASSLFGDRQGFLPVMVIDVATAVRTASGNTACLAQGALLNILL